MDYIFIRNFLASAAAMVVLFIILIAVLAARGSHDYGSCNAASIALHGQIITSPSLLGSDAGEVEYADSGAIANLIDRADADPSIQAIVLDIDSPGGAPVAGEEVAHSLMRAHKPTVALIRSLGTSAAYWAATGAGAIFASRNSDVGSIGVTQSYVDTSVKDYNDGLTYNQITSGEYKDIGSPDKPLTDEEYAILKRGVDQMRDNFVADVAANRRLELSQVNALADGTSMLGQEALGAGLIDYLGDSYDVSDYLSRQIGHGATLCPYEEQ